MNRLTMERCNGIKSGYWTTATKEELVQRLAAYENTGLEPEQILELTSWRNAKKDPPPYGESVIVARPYRQYGEGAYKVEQGRRDLNGWWKVYGTNCKSITHWLPMPKPPKEG